jgi:hypothetical protein
LHFFRSKSMNQPSREMNSKFFETKIPAEEGFREPIFEFATPKPDLTPDMCRQIEEFKKTIRILGFPIGRKKREIGQNAPLQSIRTGSTFLNFAFLFFLFEARLSKGQNLNKSCFFGNATISFLTLDNCVCNNFRARQR